MAECLGEILNRLHLQVGSLTAALERPHETQIIPSNTPSPPPVHLTGVLFDSARQKDPKWFVTYVTLLRAGGATSDNAQTFQLLVLSTLLCLQHPFKKLLVSGNPILPLLCNFLKSVTNLDNLDIKLWYKECVFALVKSSADKPRIVTPQMEAAGLTFQDQENLIKSMLANPQMANEAFGPNQTPSDEWMTDPDDSANIISSLVNDQVIKNLVQSKAAPSLACIARVAEYRKFLVKYGGVRILIDSESGDKEQNRVALARLCMTSNPSIWNPSQLIDLSNSCFSLFSDSLYELYKFEASIGLTNLLSVSEDVRSHIMKKSNIIDTIIDALGSSSSDQLKSAVAEVLCNLSLSDHLQSVIADGKHSELVRILVFYTCNEELNTSLKSAAGGALAIMTGNPSTCVAIEKIIKQDGFNKLIDSINVSCPEIAVRILCVISNVYQFTENENLKIYLSNKINSEKKKLDAITDERVSEVLVQLAGS